MEHRFRAVKLLFDTVTVDTGHYAFVKTCAARPKKKEKKGTTQMVNPRTNCGL